MFRFGALFTILIGLRGGLPQAYAQAPIHDPQDDIKVTDTFVLTLDAISQGRMDDAERRFEEIPKTSTEYPFAYLELQKLFYRQNAWDRFFGYALFYRTQVMARYFEPKMLLLEALALIKHCEYPAAQKILDDMRAILAKTPDEDKTKDQTLVAQDLLTLQNQLSRKVQTTAKGAPTQAFTDELHWKVDSENHTKVISRAVGNPALIRVYVRNACGDAKS